MANIKISELNSLTEKDYTDVLPIIDTSANETKKISIEKLVNINVSLVAVSSTTPSGMTQGEMYYNTTDNKIYTYVGGGEYFDNGEPKEGIFYIVFDKQSTYAYDGTTLISVGGGAGGGGSVEIGTIVPFAGSTAPSGYLMCNGQAVSRTTYADLFSVIGTSFGTGDDITTFNVPNFNGRVPVGLDETDTDFNTIGSTIGSKELQKHNHTLQDSSNSNARPLVSTAYTGTNGWGVTSNSTVVAGGTILANTTKTAGTGDSGNIQPSLVINFIIKASKKSALDKGNVVDSLDGNDTDSAPSVRAVNERFGYNLVDDGSAVKTGRKINGKDEWAKAFTFDPSSSTLSKSLGFTLSDVTVTDIRGTEKGNTGNYFSINLGDTNAGSSTITSAFDIRVNLTNGDNNINISSNVNFNYVHIEIYYYYN